MFARCYHYWYNHTVYWVHISGTLNFMHETILSLEWKDVKWRTKLWDLFYDKRAIAGLCALNMLEVHGSDGRRHKHAQTNVQQQNVCPFIDPTRIICWEIVELNTQRFVILWRVKIHVDDCMSFFLLFFNWYDSADISVEFFYALHKIVISR